MIKYKVLYDPAAINDMKEACLWYNRKQKGLAKKFTADVRAVAASISINPYFASEKQGIRKALCKKFPYSLYYEINEAEQSVSVFAVFHTSRDPLP